MPVRIQSPRSHRYRIGASIHMSIQTSVHVPIQHVCTHVCTQLPRALRSGWAPRPARLRGRPAHAHRRVQLRQARAQLGKKCWKKMPSRIGIAGGKSRHGHISYGILVMASLGQNIAHVSIKPTKTSRAHQCRAPMNTAHLQISRTHPYRETDRSRACINRSRVSINKSRVSINRSRAYTNTARL